MSWQQVTLARFFYCERIMNKDNNKKYFMEIVGSDRLIENNKVMGNNNGKHCLDDDKGSVLQLNITKNACDYRRGGP